MIDNINWGKASQGKMKLAQDWKQSHVVHVQAERNFMRFSENVRLSFSWAFEPFLFFLDNFATSQHSLKLPMALTNYIFPQHLSPSNRM